MTRTRSIEGWQRTVAATVSLLALAVGATPASAQLYTEIPGVTSASVPYLGGSQRRYDFDLSFYRGSALVDRAWGVEGRLAYGRSFRVFSNWELGYDLSWADIVYLQPATPKDESEPPTDSAGTGSWTGHALYGLSLGVKYRFISYVSPRREGIEAAAFFTFQPSLRTGISHLREGGSSWTGGLLRSPSDDEAPSRPFFEIPRASAFGLAIGYRTRRLTAETVLGFETAGDVENPAVASYSGFTPRIGISYRLTPGFTGGIAYWGDGSPPWQAEAHVPRIERKAQSFAVVLSFGSEPGAGTDLIIAPPSGAFDESVRLFLRGRTSY